FKGVNPCVEILLDSYGLCNLTTINVLAFVKDGKLDLEGLLEAQRMSARAGYRMTCVDLELDKWDRIQKRDRLLGCSVTGWKDAMEALGYTKEQEQELQRMMHKVAREAADEYADFLGLNRPLLVTAVKPEGTISRSEEHTSELQSRENLVCRLLLEKKKKLVIKMLKFKLFRN